MRLPSRSNTVFTAPIALIHALTFPGAFSPTGLFGAGLLGMLMGNGFFGGLGGLASMMGLLLQIGLIVLVISFAMKWFRSRRQEPSYAGPQGYNRTMTGGGSVPPAGNRPMAGGGSAGGGLAGGLGGLGGGALGGMLGGMNQQRRRTDVRDEIGIGEQDYAAFERSLVELQDAYSRQDIEKIWTFASSPSKCGRHGKCSSPPPSPPSAAQSS